MQINRARRKTHPWGHVGGLYPKAFPTSPLSLILTFKFILISDNSNIIVFIIYLFSFLTALPSSLGQEQNGYFLPLLSNFRPLLGTIVLLVCVFAIPTCGTNLFTIISGYPHAQLKCVVCRYFTFDEEKTLSYLLYLRDYRQVPTVNSDFL